ncbi:T9SS type A sorting domain-containing protein [Hymenobacter sp. ASUV-10]|uniref:T9SS type A sorting domain-containing protein n=1 Tax=Hymenobacter aranciens TaxID=3063996 RepID=A0ABT9BDA5_9BACT|nr:T9SS type A sorting domain-containing protein [Hymenobacter sp. ASUV-10]MDO7876182.1 T9SS type A sorting domain-containing protein [Hymenobacter sp. ASUV-10]
MTSPQFMSSYRYFLSLLLLLLTLPARAQWVAQPFTFDTPDVLAYRFAIVDANVLWAAGYDESFANRSVALTTNGGTTWTRRPVPTLTATEFLTSVSATSALDAWVTIANATSGGRLLHTTDGGTTWTAPAAAPNFGPALPNFVHFFTPTNGVAVADPLSAPTDTFAIFVTRDGGLTWRPAASVPAPLPDENGVVLAPVAIGNFLWFATDEGRVFTSPDQGDTWLAAVSNTVAAEQYAVAFTDAAHGITVSVNGATSQQYLHATTDGGLTWQLLPHTGPLFSAGIAGVPGTNLLLSVGAGDLGPNDVGSSYSRDFGATWTALETSQYHVGVAAHGPTAVWSGASRADATSLGIYRLGATALATRPTARPAQPAYPNPSLTGEFRLPLPAAPATVAITDALGREVFRTTTPGLQPELALSLRGHAPGVYLLTLSTAAGTTRQQLVVQ